MKNNIKLTALRLLCNTYMVEPKAALQIIEKKFYGNIDSFVDKLSFLKHSKESWQGTGFEFEKLCFECLGSGATNIKYFFSKKDLMEEYMDLQKALLEEQKDWASVKRLITLLLFGIGGLSYYLIRPLL